MTVALLHAVPAGLADCELTFVARQPIDLERARAQHRGYCELLQTLGAELHLCDASPGHPDAAFVEDCAVATDELLVATAMGAASRRAEVDNLLPVLRRFGAVAQLPASVRLEGGDVLRSGRTLYVGRSPRTDRAGIDALAALLHPFGYRVQTVAVHGCLHLKTAVTALAPDTVLANTGWIDPAPFAGLRVVPVDEDEPFAANTLPLGGAVLMSASHPRSIARVRGLGFDVRPVAIDEFEKAEAGVTCLSVLLPGRAALPPRTGSGR